MAPGLKTKESKPAYQMAWAKELLENGNNTRATVHFKMALDAATGPTQKKALHLEMAAIREASNLHKADPCGWMAFLGFHYESAGDLSADPKERKELYEKAADAYYMSKTGFGDTNGYLENAANLYSKAAALTTGSREAALLRALARKAYIEAINGPRNSELGAHLRLLRPLADVTDNTEEKRALKRVIKVFTSLKRQ
jgi:hypothetical protein